MTNKKFNHTQAVYFKAIAEALEKANVPIMYETIMTVEKGKNETVEKEMPLDEVIEFLNYKIEQVNRRNTSNGKSKASEENAEIAEKVFEFLTEHEGTAYKNSELAKHFEVNPQKMTPILKCLEGRIDKIKFGKGYAYGIGIAEAKEE